MKAKSNFSVNRDQFVANEEVNVNGYKFIYTAIHPKTAGKGTEVYGVLTLPTGEQKSYIDKPILVSRLNAIAGVTVSRADTSKKENSQSRGTNKVVSVSSLSDAKINNIIRTNHKKAVKAYYQLLDTLGLPICFSGASGLQVAFMKELNNFHRETRIALENKLKREHERLANVAKSKDSIARRVQLLRDYIAKYDTNIVNLLSSDNKDNKDTAMKLVLDKDANIAKAQRIIETYDAK